MKHLLIFAFLILSTYSISQKDELYNLINKGQYEKAIEIGKGLLISEPDSFNTYLSLLKAYNGYCDYENAQKYIDKSIKLSNVNWQKSWTFIEATYAFFGAGKVMEARKMYDNAKLYEGTKKSVKALNSLSLLFGFDDLYNDWEKVETENMIFHFQNGISKNDIDYIVKSRQSAFEEINSFFQSKLPKKIDFFVWNQSESFNTYLNTNLGFSNPKFCISHNRLNQSKGHEIAHNISFWKNKNNNRNGFINEGIGVCFDLENNDKLQIAKEIYKTNQIEIKEMWKSPNLFKESLLYPISGAFICFLKDYNKNKFIQLVENQSYESAEKIYDGKIDELISQFTNSIKQ